MAAKESFDAAYAGPTAAPYYRLYEPTRLSIVEYAAGLVRFLYKDKGNEDQQSSEQIIDLGCAFGTMGMLLRSGLRLEQIYRSYIDGEQRLPAADIDFSPSILGVDSSRPAIAEALRLRTIDSGVVCDLNAVGALAGQRSSEAIAVCTAVLGYVTPAALSDVVARVMPRAAVVTCVTWLCDELDAAFTDSPYMLCQLTETPVFQRWATPGEETKMSGALVAGAHRAHCFVLSTDPDRLPTAELASVVEALRYRRGLDPWLAAGRSSCELA
jgi:hypothetical protein